MHAGLTNIKTRSLAAVLVLGMMAACAPVPEETTDGFGQEVANTSGLEEKLPDTCKLDNYQSFVGQPLAAVTIPSSVKSRIVKPSTILTQEYVSDRVNFHVDEAGTIFKVICG